MSEKITLKRAIFLRGVSDPVEFSRVTTTLFRPKHDDLRLEDGFVCSRELRVPVSNVVELIVLAEPVESAEQAPDEAVEEPKVEEVRRRGRPRKVPAS